jgi:hypothetical protein
MSPDIRELFDAAADDSRRPPIDADALLSRGRRKVRIRAAGATLGSGVLAAAAVLAVTQFPRPAAEAPVAPADTPSTTVAKPTAPPKVSPTPPTTMPPQSAAQTSGAELLRKLSYAEAVRRCGTRMKIEYGASGTPVPAELGPGESQREGMYVTDLLQYRLPDGTDAYCSVPGSARPSYTDKPSAPPGDARAECGRLSWTDLTSWTVAEQRDADGGLTATLLSNDRSAMLQCDLDGPGATRDKTTAFPNATVYLLYGPRSKGRPSGAPSGVLSAAPDSTAVHWLGAVKDGRQIWGGGGLASKGAIRYALFAGKLSLADAKVAYGIYALRVWLPAGAGEPNLVRGYDAKGNVVESYQPF